MSPGVQAVIWLTSPLWLLVAGAAVSDHLARRRARKIARLRKSWAERG